MIYSLNGKLVYTESNLAVIECAGVGYACTVSGSTMRSLPGIGGNVMLYTRMSVSQDNVSLFGFATKTELACFKMLTGVSGIGAKTAISLLSSLSPEQIALSVGSGDYKALTRAQGIGPKQAQRICLELKDKVTGLGAPKDMMPVMSGASAADNSSADSSAWMPSQKCAEAVQALMVLGYTSQEASKAVAQCDADGTVEKMIGQALRLMAQ